MSSENLSPTEIVDEVTINKEGVLTGVSGEFIKNVQSYIIPNTVKKIGKNAFNRCVNLTKITFPEGLESIDEAAFYLCKSLLHAQFPNSLASIGPAAFALCINLQTVTIGRFVTKIGDNAFMKCYSLTSFFVSLKNKTFLNDAPGCLINKRTKTLLQYPIKRKPVDKSYTIPNNITTIGSNAFRSCKTLTSVNLKDVTIIQDYAFAYCTNLITVNNNKNFFKIGNRAFYLCMKLEKAINIADVKSIGDQAFYNLSLIHI